MKTLKKILLTILVLVMSLTLVSFTWEGELNPDEFGSWVIVGSSPLIGELFWLFLKNPDQTSPIKIVAVLTDFGLVRYGYRYFKYGEPYKYMFNVEQDKYVRKHLTEEERQRCMKCHGNKFKIEAKILIGDFKNG